MNKIRVIKSSLFSVVFFSFTIQNGKKKEGLKVEYACLRLA